MKYVTALLLAALCLIGLVILVFLVRDDPQYADGEPIAIVKDWLSKQPQSDSSTPIAANVDYENTTAADAGQGKAIWTEEYLGNGKWLVTKANLRADYSKTDMTFEEWIARTKGWDANRLTEYSSDLSPEDQETFQEQLRTYNSGQQDFDAMEKWYIYEKSGLTETVKE